MNKIPQISKIPVVILAGGFGTRMREQTEFIPKPMVPIGDRPILWHIMKIYAHYGFRRFIVCLGYKGDTIKEFFYHYHIHNCDFTVKLGNHKDIKIHNTHGEDDWEVTLVHTGLAAMTGARIKRIERYVPDADVFMLTYGDGVADINLQDLLEFHFHHGKIATITGVRPPARFGELVTENHQVVQFSEKPQISSGFINGGFFVFNKRVFSYVTDADACTLEKEALENLTHDHELMMYEHRGFWQCMDTLRNMDLLNQCWQEGRALWKVWKDT
ncbi:MAG: glucose-1-phosphate cytidylyltransferase [Candidatus Omnitrophota bacterium]|jgi:glucose-1-phosphate cytidylyltransferase